MNAFRAIPVILCFSAASAVLAHQGVKNPAVKARMDSMATIGQNTKVIGQMAKGAAPFDAEAARVAAAGIAQEAARTPVLFAAREDDPTTEARSEIWDNFEDFRAKSKALVAVAEDAAASIASEEDLRPVMASLGQTCKACHGDYRE